ncbi:MAG TPA: hypothetical protein VII50_07570 [Acidothermaceae bacterium]
MASRAIADGCRLRKPGGVVTEPGRAVDVAIVDLGTDLDVRRR